MVDNFKRRLDAMNRRLYAWELLVTDYIKKNVDVRMVMYTLTYKRVRDYKAGHIGKFTRDLRDRLQKKLLAWAWVAELQKRGAVHYHVVALVEKGTDLPYPDENGMWNYGMTKIQEVDNIRYLFSYQGKTGQKDLEKFPKNARLYATSIRFGGKETKEVFRRLAGISGKVRNADWYYVGSSVTESYARNVLSSGKIE